MAPSHTIIVSNQCNNKCLNCVVKTPAHLTFFDNSYLQKVLLPLKKRYNNIKTISLTGGEPTLNPNLFGIIRDITNLFPKTEIVILTNGRMFAYRNYVNEITKLNLKNLKIVVSIYAAREDVHNAITCVKDSYKQTVAGIYNLMRFGFITELRVVINKVNYGYLKETTKYIYDNFNKISYLVYLAMELNESTIKNNIYISYNEFVPFLSDALEIRRVGIKVKLYHFPLCSINQRFHGLIHRSIERCKTTFLPSCKICLKRTKCAGILKTYFRYLGSREFNPIKN